MIFSPADLGSGMGDQGQANQPELIKPDRLKRLEALGICKRRWLLMILNSIYFWEIHSHRFQILYTYLSRSSN